MIGEDVLKLYFESLTDETKSFTDDFPVLVHPQSLHMSKIPIREGLTLSEQEALLTFLVHEKRIRKIIGAFPWKVAFHRLNPSHELTFREIAKLCYPTPGKGTEALMRRMYLFAVSMANAIWKRIEDEDTSWYEGFKFRNPPQK